MAAPSSAARAFLSVVAFGTVLHDSAFANQTDDADPISCAVKREVSDNTWKTTGVRTNINMCEQGTGVVKIQRPSERKCMRDPN